ncbi:FAD/NAD(P)-binding domain-containing protein [Pleomassaria siparia CBS 279.74]|uniref:FAD/NAD(P)-binding domain-containing protein n=1 Tax=Pleomassaria siparia CBS 279.74 TaxID=1314801 RepID=A0A6G1K0W8_9PLEO|nr:FAD/NAD(P)-binding domain-containing protein [Pleomassaria siparia CBS 279.74]
MESKERIKVAVVGSGMAGLATAYLLRRDPRKRYKVVVFESGKSLSLDSASVSVPNATRTASDRVDLPMRAFAGGYYSNLKDMYDHLGVRYHAQPFLFEFAKALVGPEQRSRSSSYFIHASNLHELPPPRPSGVSTLSHLAEVLYLVACYSWFSICCFLVAPREIEQTNFERHAETLDQYTRRIWLPEYFLAYYLLPLMSGVTTCPHEALLKFPARDLIEYKRRTHGAPHYTVSNGVSTVQDRLADGLEYKLCAAVSKVEPQESGIKISWVETDGKDSHCEEVFDKVVLAVAPDIVGRIFEPLQRHMARIPTALVESTVHTDRSMLGINRTLETSKPDDHLAQLICLQTTTDGQRQTESIHVQPCGAIVTTCPFSPIDSSLTVCSAKFTRVLRSPESRSIVNSIFGDTPYHPYENEKKRPLWRNGDDNVWLAGGWCWDGMVLLEGCVVSATRIADAFGVDVPWRK